VHHVLLFAIRLTVHPKTAPIDKPLQELLNVLVATGLIAAAIGFVSGGAMSAVGGQSGNYGLAARGKSMMAWAAFAAALIAGGAAIINWFWGLGLLI
jgi:hypothetical protein